MRNKQLCISSKLSINLNNNICNAGFVKGYLIVVIDKVGKNKRISAVAQRHALLKCNYHITATNRPHKKNVILKSAININEELHQLLTTSSDNIKT
jgi:hypothetical protein